MSFAGSGSNNSILVSGCKNLENLTVTFKVTQDLITVGDKGFSLQLNSYPQPTSITPNSTPGTTFPGKVVGQLDWFQYLIIVANKRVSFEIQYWASAKSYQTGGPGGSEQHAHRAQDHVDRTRSRPTPGAARRRASSSTTARPRSFHRRSFRTGPVSADRNRS